MKSFLSLIVAAVVVASPLVASPSLSLEASDTNSDQPAARIAVAPALAIMSGEVGGGFDAGVTFRTNSPIYVGFQTGVYRWSASATSSTGISHASLSATVIPLMATALYRFETNSAVHPYIGLSLGAALATGYASVSYQDDSSSASASKIFFQGLVRPGVEFDLTPGMALTVEPKFGVLKDEFVFLPHLGLSFSI